MPAKSETDALVILLDVGQSMTTRQGNLTYLQSCLNIVQMICERKMYQSSKDEVALVLYGTRDTANTLHKPGKERYAHVTLARPLANVDWNFLDYVQTSIAASNLDGDVLDGLLVAANELNKSSKAYNDKRIFVFTDFSADAADADEVAQICEGLEKEDIHVYVVSPFDAEDDEDDEKDEADKPRTSRDNDDDRPKQNGHAEKKPLTAKQAKTRDLLKEVATRTEGVFNSFENVVELLSVQQAKIARSAGTKYEMTIGESFRLPIVAQIRIKENRPELFRFKKVYAKDESVELKMERARFTKDEEQRDLGAEDTVDAFRYGSSYVPISNEEGLKLAVEKSFNVLGFTKSENIKRYYYLGDSIYQIMTDPAAGEQAEETFVNMVHAMYNDDVCGLVRRVYNKNSTPEIAALIPHITSGLVCLLYVAMPFDDDIRRFTLTNFTALDRYKPSERQLKLMDDLIDSFELKKEVAKSGDDDEDADEDEEMYDPTTVFNPFIQRMFQSISARSANPKGELPDFEQHLTSRKRKQTEDSLRTSAVVKVLRQCVEQFPLKINEKKLSKVQQQSCESASLDSNGGLFSESKTKAMCSDLIDENKKIEELDLNSMLGKVKGSGTSSSADEVTRVGTQTPIEDFRSLAAKCERDTDLFDEICTQIQARTREFLKESLNQSVLSGGDSIENINSSYQQMAADCIRVQRQFCVKLKRADLFNQYMSTFKIFLMRDPANKKFGKQVAAFWNKFVREGGLTLISKDEEPESSEMSRADAQDFLDFGNKTAELAIAKTVEVKDEENVENLLDLM